MPESFTPRQIAVKGWAGLTTPDAVRKAADLLTDYDWLRKDTAAPGATGGRPSERYSINPAAMQDGAMANVTIDLNHGFAIRKPVHHAAILNIGPFFDHNPTKVATQACQGSDITTRADDHVTD